MCHCAFCHTLKVIVCSEGRATSLLRPDQSPEALGVFRGRAVSHKQLPMHVVTPS